MSNNKRYFKLGENSFHFFDPMTRLQVKKNTPGVLTNHEAAADSFTFAEALRAKNIVEISESEYKEMMATKKENMAASKEAKATATHLKEKTDEEKELDELAKKSAEEAGGKDDDEEDDYDEDFEKSILNKGKDNKKNQGHKK